MTARPTRSRRRALLATLLPIVIGLVGLEVAARAFWRIQYRIPLLPRPSHVLYAFYPELKIVDALRPHRGDRHYNVLLLGESVLHPAWGEVQPALSERLEASGVTNARIFSLAAPAQTTRDSRLKYAALAGATFDVVLVYHGINESRANNAPPDIFRADYSHYQWYDIVNTLAPSHGSALFAFPYTARYAAVLAGTASREYVSVNDPRPEWIQYGSDLRSAASFEQNLTAILDVAETRGDRMMLITFALDVPSNYSKAAFVQHRLDYGRHRSSLETWGRPDNVVAAVAAHNAVIRRLASSRKGALFVDQDALMERSARNFDDVCHLTIAGSLAFADHIVSALRP